ncbi:MAG: hypothetical protein IPI62_14530 [Bacteroidetes bacterium]|nr:hypothetical protein [Bacteroidota bacterium]
MSPSLSKEIVFNAFLTGNIHLCKMQSIKGWTPKNSQLINNVSKLPRKPQRYNQKEQQTVLKKRL